MVLIFRDILVHVVGTNHIELILVRQISRGRFLQKYEGSTYSKIPLGLQREKYIYG